MVCAAAGPKLIKSLDLCRDKEGLLHEGPRICGRTTRIPRLALDSQERYSFPADKHHVLQQSKHYIDLTVLQSAWSQSGNDAVSIYPRRVTRASLTKLWRCSAAEVSHIQVSKWMCASVGPSTVRLLSFSLGHF